MRSQPPARWGPGLVSRHGQPVMPIGLTANELEALAAHDEQQRVAELAATAAASTGGDEPATPLAVDHNGSTVAMLDEGVGGTAAPGSPTRAATPGGGRSAARVAAGDASQVSEGGSSCFESVNRVATVAGSEYARRRSGERGRAVARGAGARTPSLGPQVQQHQAWHQPTSHDDGAAPLAEPPQRAGGAAGQYLCSGAVAAWLADSAAASAVGPEAANREPAALHSAALGAAHRPNQHDDDASTCWSACSPLASLTRLLQRS